MKLWRAAGKRNMNSTFETWGETGVYIWDFTQLVPVVSRDFSVNPWVNILKSIDEGLFKRGKFKETLAEGAEAALHLGPERDRVFADLTPEEKKRFKADIRATNILLQGLPKDIYTLINQYTDAKDIWDNVKMLLEGRFVTAIKLNRGLKQSNYDQLYAYLKKYEAHSNENKMILERYNQHAIDPLTFVSNVSPQSYPTQSSNILQSAYVPPVTHQPQFADNTHLDLGGQANPFDDDVNEAPVQDFTLNKDNIFQANKDRIYLIRFEFSSCLFADLAINLNPSPAALYCPLEYSAITWMATFALVAVLVVRAGRQYLLRHFDFRTFEVRIELFGLFLSQWLAAPVRDTGKARSMI
nr:hypothetical protein [Tanacetum cinerariifolium]